MLRTSPASCRAAIHHVRPPLSTVPGPCPPFQPRFFRNHAPGFSDDASRWGRIFPNVAGFSPSLLDGVQSLSPAAVTRVASKAVRLTVQSGSPAEAVTIISALREANHKRQLQGEAAMYPIRQVSTAFVHSLLATNQIRTAARYTRNVLPHGERLFKTRTIEAVVAALCPNRSARGPVGYIIGTAEAFKAPFVTSSPPPQHSHSLDPSTRLAIALLAQARRTKYKRTDNMYRRVVKACLLQGEIVTATLLFAILLSDWQMRAKQNLLDDAQEYPQYGEKVEGAMRRQSRWQAGSRMRLIQKLDLNQDSLDDAKARSQILLEMFRSGLGSISPGVDTLFPATDYYMQAIISRTGDNDLRDTDAADWVRGCLATLLLLQIMPHDGVSNLVKFLYSARPSEQKRPWPWKLEEDDEEKPWTFYDLCHAALMNLIVCLPQHRTKYYGYDCSMLTPLDKRSYRGLLHYSFRHRLSTKMGSAVLHHMVDERQPPLTPDGKIVTVLLRYTSILNLNEEFSKILAGLAIRGGPLYEALAAVDRASAPKEKNFLSRVVPLPPRPVEGQQTPFQSPLQNLYEQAVTDPFPQLDLSHATPRDFSSHMLSIIITHFTSTGRAQLLLPLLPLILPTASPDPMPADQRLAALHRTVELGPYVFSSLLNACRKAGRTGLAERVWRVGVKAERASWTAGPWGERGNGWWLTIESYTTMMQLYADEGKKGLGTYPRKSNPGTPRRQYRPEKLFNAGWSLPVFDAPNPRVTRERWLNARMAGIALNRHMRRGGMHLIKRLRSRKLLPDRLVDSISWDLEASRRLAKRPVPDARFFNACLELFGRKLGMVQRAFFRHPRSWWTQRLQKLRNAKLAGVTRSDRDPMLPQIIAYMRHLGYEVPIAFAHLETGRVEESRDLIPLEDFKDMHKHLQRRIVRPLVYAPRKPHHEFSPFQIPVTKDRGLPIRRGQGRQPLEPEWIPKMRERLDEKRGRRSQKRQTNSGRGAEQPPVLRSKGTDNWTQREIGGVPKRAVAIGQKRS